MINAFQKLLMVMRTGEVIKIEDFENHFKEKNDEKMVNTMYRLSAYMWSLKNHEHAIIKSHKNGRNVIGYQLINFKDYNENGEYTRNDPV